MTNPLGTLTERRKADRAKMAAILESEMREAGATVTRPEAYCPRQVRLEIAVPGGAYIDVDFDGDSWQPDVHVATWNVRSDSLFAFSAAFGNINEYHFSKANRVAYGFDHLLAGLRRDVAMLLDGRGYSIVHAAKRAADRRKHFEDSRHYLAALVAEGRGTTWADGSECETPEQVRAQYERLPTLIAQLDAFVDAGCPMAACTGFPWSPRA